MLSKMAPSRPRVLDAHANLTPVGLGWSVVCVLCVTLSSVV